MLETENHVLNNCSVAAMQGRYTWRHNAVLKHLVSILQAQLRPSDKLYADIEGYDNPQDIFNGSRPDLVIIRENITYVLELTCCYETNLSTSSHYKQQKYCNLQAHNLILLPTIVHTLEISSLGFVNDAGLVKLCKLLNLTSPSLYKIRQLGDICLRCSYFIFCCRHKQWPHAISDPFFY